MITARVHPGESNASWMMTLGTALSMALLLHWYSKECKSPKPPGFGIFQNHAKTSKTATKARYGFMSFLLSPAAEAKALRQARGKAIVVNRMCSALICSNPSLASKAFKWLIVPMLNPDGVVRGCYRCGGSLGFVYLFLFWESFGKGSHQTLATVCPLRPCWHRFEPSPWLHMMPPCCPSLQVTFSIRQIEHRSGQSWQLKKIEL